MKKMNVIKLGVKATVLLAPFALTIPIFAADLPASTTTNGNITFDPAGEEPDPVDPNEEESPHKIKPEVPSGTTGLLRINQAPTLDFGAVKLDGGKIEANARYRTISILDDSGAITGSRFTPNFLQVKDIRGNKFGWKVTVAGSDLGLLDEKEEMVTGSEVVGAMIHFTNGDIVSNSGVSEASLKPTTSNLDLKLESGTPAIPVLEAGSGNAVGYGIWSLRYGAEDPKATENTRPNNIKLEIPASSTKTAGNYRAKLTWTIEETP